MISEPQIDPGKGARWHGRANVDRFVAATDPAHAPQRLKDAVEADIVRRFARGDALLDAGIGTGRVSLPLLRDGLRLTGVDASPAMIERCAADPRAAGVRLVAGDLAALPFAAHTFDTVLSADAFVFCTDWIAALDELLRVTRPGGRVIVDVGSHDHLAAVAGVRGCSIVDVLAAESDAAGSLVHLTQADLAAFAAGRDATLIALLPYGAAMGSLVPNYWTSASYAARSGGLDRLVSWIGADTDLYGFAAFIERRIVQQLSSAVCSRMYAIIERRPGAVAAPAVSPAQLAACDERGAAAWHAEFAAHLAHEPSRAFAVALFAALHPARLPREMRAVLPAVLLHDLERHERAADAEFASAALLARWREATGGIHFHGVDLSAAIAPSLLRVLRAAEGQA